MLREIDPVIEIHKKVVQQDGAILNKLDVDEVLFLINTIYGLRSQIQHTKRIIKTAVRTLNRTGGNI